MSSHKNNDPQPRNSQPSNPSSQALDAQKIQYLHKMLDNEISTVNTLFEKDNAFDQIEAKLKLLQVKLSSIREEGNPITVQNFRSGQQQAKSDSKFYSCSIEASVRNQQVETSKCVEDLPFQSLSKYKNMKKAEKTIEKSKSKRKARENYNQYSASGKKLNFDADEDQENRTTNKMFKSKQKSRQKSRKKSLNKKIRSEIILPQHEPERRPKSRNQEPDVQKSNKSIYKTISRQNSTKKPRNSATQSTKKPHISSTKKLAQSKTASHLPVQSWKDIVNIYSNSKNKEKTALAQLEKKEKVKEIIRKSQAKRLEKQLKTYKVKNQTLQHQVSELKGYKMEFQKLKSIFQKEERIRKSRRRI